MNSAIVLDRASDRDALDFAPVIPRMRAFARCLAGDRDAADELVKAALTSACQDRCSRNADLSLEVWLLTLVRDQSRAAAFAAGLSTPAPPGRIERLGWISETETIRSSMRLLSRDDREALALRDGARLTYAAAAAVCDCTIASLYCRVAAGREALWVLCGAGAQDSPEAQPGNHWDGLALS